MKLIKFIILLIIILVIFYILNKYGKKENFKTNNIQSTEPSNTDGIYNYFYQSYMNPYSLPLKSFFSNDKVNKVNLYE